MKIEMENRPCLLAFKNGGMKTGNVILQTGVAGCAARVKAYVKNDASLEKSPDARKT
jgi:hypothetical protein